MAENWQDIEQARLEKRHELVLTGPEISKQIADNGLDAHIFNLKQLNFLEISKTCLENLSEDVGKLSNLTNLILHNNKLKTLPACVQELKKLKILDVSNNELESIPDGLCSLGELQSLNVSCNNLENFPSVECLENLHILQLSHNKLEFLPDGVTSSKLTHLAEIHVNGNLLKELPDDFTELPALKHLDVSDNKLDVIPSEIGECLKIKDLKIMGNKLKDRRLMKMGQDCKTKSVMDYLRNALQKERQKGGGKKTKPGKKERAKMKGSKESNDVDEIAKNLMHVLHFQDEEGLTVTMTENVSSVRKQIVCCIVRNLDMAKTKNMFKRFLSLQTRLHEGICNKRQTATIATHDLSLVKGPLVYDSKLAAQLMLIPLHKQKEISAEKLVSKLVQEAEELRREKKRNTISGIHKYLDLLKGKPNYPFLADRDGTVISFPPITNCESTKISPATTDILIEVTSTLTQDSCKKVMEALLSEMLEMGIGQFEKPNNQTSQSGDENSDNEGASGPAPPTGNQEVIFKEGQHLVVEQVKILNSEGLMKSVYPSRVDLQSDKFEVVRESK